MVDHTSGKGEKEMRCERCDSETAKRREIFVGEHWEHLCDGCWMKAITELVGRIIRDEREDMTHKGLTREDVSALERLGFFPIVTSGDRELQVLCAGCGRWMYKIGAAVKHGTTDYYHAACVLAKASV